MTAPFLQRSRAYGQQIEDAVGGKKALVAMLRNVQKQGPVLMAGGGSGYAGYDPTIAAQLADAQAYEQQAGNLDWFNQAIAPQAPQFIPAVAPAPPQMSDAEYDDSRFNDLMTRYNNGVTLGDEAFNWLKGEQLRRELAFGEHVAATSNLPPPIISEEAYREHANAQEGLKAQTGDRNAFMDLMGYEPAPPLTVRGLGYEKGKDAFVAKRPGGLEALQGNLASALDAYSKVNVDVPVLTPLLQDYVKPVVKTALNTSQIGGQVNTIADLLSQITGKNLPSYGEFGSSLVPTKSADIALTAAPFAGKAKGLLFDTGVGRIPTRLPAIAGAAEDTAEAATKARIAAKMAAGEAPGVKSTIPGLAESLNNPAVIQAKREAAIAGTSPTRITLPEVRQQAADLGLDTSGSMAKIQQRIRQAQSAAEGVKPSTLLDEMGHPAGVKPELSSKATWTQGSQNAPPLEPPPPNIRKPSAAKPSAEPEPPDAIVEQFKKSLAGVTENVETSRFRTATSGLRGTYDDPFVTELVNHEKQLKPALEANIAKATTEEEQTVLAKEIGKKITQFRSEALTARYGADTPERAAAEAIMLKRDVAEAANGPNAFDKLQASGKQVKFGVDLGSTFQQDFKATRMGSTSVATDLLRKAVGIDVFPNKAIGEEAQMLADGLRLGGAQTAGLEAGTAARSLPGKILRAPIAATEKLNDIQFSFLEQIRKSIYRGRLAQAVGIGQDISDPVVRRAAAEFANTATSTAMVSPKPGYARWSGRVMLSDPMTRSMAGEIGTVFKSLRSPTDALNTANQIASTVALFGAMYEANKEIGITSSLEDFAKTVANPLSPQFGKLILKAKDGTGANQVWSFLPQFAMENAILKALRATVDAAKGDKTANEALTQIGDAMARFGVGRLNVLPGAATALGGLGYDPSGQFHYGDMSLKDRGLTALPSPLSLTQTVQQGIKGELNPVGAAGNFLGANIYSESPFQGTDRLVQDEIKKGLLPSTYKDDNGKVQAITKYSQLIDADPNAAAEFDSRHGDMKDARLKASRESTQAAQLIRDQANEVQDHYDTELLLTDPADWRAKSGDVQHDADVRIDQIYRDAGKFTSKPKTFADKVSSEYHDILVEAGLDENNPIKDSIDWDKVDELTAQKSKDWNDQREKNRLKGETKPRQEFLSTAPLRDPYFEIRDTAWEQAKGRNASLAPYKNVDDYVREWQLRFMAKGIPREEARSEALDLASAYMDTATGQQEIYLLKHRDALANLYKFGYFIPADLEELAGLGAR